MIRKLAALMVLALIAAPLACTAKPAAPQTQPATAPAATAPGAQTQPATAPADPLQAALANAAELPAEELGMPVRTVTRSEMMIAPNPDGKTLDLLQWYFRGYSGPTTVIIMDLGTGEVKKDTIPDNLQIHICGRAVGPDGKIYIATPWGYKAERKGMQLFVYDPATNQLSDGGIVAAKVDGENRPMTVATDGMVFGTGSYTEFDQCNLYQIDTDTGQRTDWGRVGPSLEPHGCWSKSIAADDKFVYISTAHHERHVFAVDRQTRQSKVLLTAENVEGDISVRQTPDGCTARGKKIRGTDGEETEYWLYHGMAIAKADSPTPPWAADGVTGDERMARIARQIDGVEIYNENCDPKSDGTAEVWYRFKDDGEQAEWQKIAFTAPTYPAGIGLLTTLSDGRIFGTAGGYSGNFMYDPKTGENKHLGKIWLSHYCTAEIGGKIYMSGYPSSPLFVYDPAKPWTAGGWGTPQEPPLADNDPRANPHMPLRLRQWAGTHKMLAAVVAGNGKAYFGGTWIRDGQGGGLAWYDPAAQTGGGTWEPFSNYRITEMTTAGDRGQYVVMATTAAKDVVLNKPMPEQGKLFVYDTRDGSICREIEPVAKAVALGPVAGVGGSRVLGVAGDPQAKGSTILYIVDVASGEMLMSKSLPVQVGGDFVLGPDKRVWTYMNKVLVRIDPADLGIAVVGKLPRGGHFAFSGRDLYFGGGSTLQRVKEIVP